MSLSNLSSFHAHEGMGAREEDGSERSSPNGSGDRVSSVRGLSQAVRHSGRRLEAVEEPATKIVADCERQEVSEHPLFVRLRRQPVNLRALWVLVANTHAGISPNFVRWLSTTIGRMDDRRIASLMAKQLNDELGDGDFARIHGELLARFVDGLSPWQPPRPERYLWAGERLAKRSAPLFEKNHPFEAVGALIVAEIFAKKMDRCLGEEIRRQSEVPADALRWLEIHEVLEVAHADDSGELARLVPDSGACLEATWSGADAQWRALWEFLDGVDQTVSELAEAD